MGKEGVSDSLVVTVCSLGPLTLNSSLATVSSLVRNPGPLIQVPNPWEILQIYNPSYSGGQGKR